MDTGVGKKRFVPHPIESQIVRRMFEMIERGNSGRVIAADRNRHGYSRTNGKEWTAEFNPGQPIPI